jgi:hypothetical protein
VLFRRVNGGILEGEVDGSSTTRADDLRMTCTSCNTGPAKGVVVAPGSSYWWQSVGLHLHHTPFLPFLFQIPVFLLY